MKSLAWLTLFFVAANAVGLSVWLLVAGLIRGFPQSVDPDLGAGWILLFLGADAIFGGPLLIAAAASVVRSWLGKLTGFAAGATAVVIVTLLGLVAGQPGVEIGAGMGFVKLLGAVLLARIPLFRRKALDLAPPSRVRGLWGTYAIAIGSGESPAEALGRRAAGERRWILFRASRPHRWQLPAVAGGGLQRDPTDDARRVLFGNRRAGLGWAALLASLPVAWICVRLFRSTRETWPVSPSEGLAIVALALLTLGLVRFGVLRLYEVIRLLHLLRDGHLVHATRGEVALFELRDGAMTVGETNEGRFLVISPAPRVASNIQGILVGKNGDAVAWDLLPFIRRRSG